MNVRGESTKRFHIGDLISITSGLLVSPDHMGGVYRVIDYVTGIPHFTHQLPRGADACKPWLIEQHPWLADITVPAINSEADLTAFLAKVAAQHGEFHDVQPLPLGAYVVLGELEHRDSGTP